MRPILYQLIALLFAPSLLNAQITTDFSAQLGTTQASGGPFTKWQSCLNYSWQDWSVGFTGGLTFSATRSNRLDGIRIHGQRKLPLREHGSRLNVFYQWTPFSSRIQEQHIGGYFNYPIRKWDLSLGFNSQIISLRPGYRAKKAEPQKRLWEAFNLLYRAEFTQPINQQANLKLALTNYDHLLLNQESNPFLLVGGDYQIGKQSKLYFDIAYLEAGLFNIRVNYYGVYAKLGYQYSFATQPSKSNQNSQP